MKTARKAIAIFLVILTLFTTCSVSISAFATYEQATIGNVTDGNVPGSEIEVDKEKKEAIILSEIIEKRDETEKRFVLSDGSFLVARYSQPIHYQNNDGVWIDYNNTLTETNTTTEQATLFGTDEIYSTNNQVENVVFAKKSNSNTLVSYEAKDYPISFNYQSANKSNIKIVEKKEELGGDDAFLILPNLTQEVLYENVFDKVDLQYFVGTNGLKENIILKDKNAQMRFAVNYNIGDLSAKAISKNEIHLTNGKDVIYVISAPVMYDVNGNSSSEIELDITKNKNGKLCFEIIPDENWLSTAVYPVTIDPSIIDAKEYSISGICVNGTSTSTDNFTITHGSTSYALLDIQKIDANDFVDHVVSAKLNLPVVSGSVTASSRVYVREITGNWKSDDGITNTNPSVATTVEDYVNITL